MQAQVDQWLHSSEFERFIQSTAQAMQLISQKDQKILQEKLIEMGRFYNHFIFQVSQSFLALLKEKAPEIQDQEVISKSLKIFLQELEKQAQVKWGDVFLFFVSYRDKIKMPIH